MFCLGLNCAVYVVLSACGALVTIPGNVMNIAKFKFGCFLGQTVEICKWRLVKRLQWWGITSGYWS